MTFKINRRQIFLVVFDAVLIILSAYLALLLRFDYRVPSEYLNLQSFHFATLALRLTTYYAFGLYGRIWRHASISELITVIFAVTVSSLLVYAYTFQTQPLMPPSSTYIIAWFLNVGAAGGIRFLLRIFPRRSLNANEATSRVLIVGAGAAGTIIAKELRKQFSSYKKLPVGFIDDDPGKRHCSVIGLKVLGTREQMPALIHDHRITEIIIAIPTAAREEVKAITRIASHLPVKVNIIPGVHEFINGDISISKIRPVEIEDLLGRPEVKLDLTEIAQYIESETILITGAGGSIGSELCRQVTRFHPKKLLVLDHTENNVYDIEMELINNNLQCDIIPIVADVRDPARIDQIFKTYKPTVIFHAAAHKHVPLMEANREEAIKNNIVGTKNVADAADRHQAKSFLLISTDKAVNPTSVMGATKRVAEMTIQILAKKSKTRLCAVRFGNVLGSRGSVIPLFKKQIEEGGPVTVTHPDMTRYFMTIPEAVQLVIQAGAMGQKGELFVLDMGDPVKITDLAHDIIRLSGFEPDKDIQIKFTGIRPGEKLFEEVLTSEEGTKTTKHERIFIAKATDQDSSMFARELKHLGQVLKVDLRGYNGQPDTINTGSQVS
jgi:FlaA1/EpsC-like NDP-sugar epimerase